MSMEGKGALTLFLALLQLWHRCRSSILLFFQPPSRPRCHPGHGGRGRTPSSRRPSRARAGRASDPPGLRARDGQGEHGPSPRLRHAVRDPGVRSAQHCRDARRDAVCVHACHSYARVPVFTGLHFPCFPSSALLKHEFLPPDLT